MKIMELDENKLNEQKLFHVGSMLVRLKEKYDLKDATADIDLLIQVIDAKNYTEYKQILNDLTDDLMKKGKSKWNINC